MLWNWMKKRNFSGPQSLFHFYGKIIIYKMIIGCFGLFSSLTYANSFKMDQINIQTKSGSHSFTVELALSPTQLREGLMHRKEMAPDAGMLFVHQTRQVQGMWMKNTFIPLDMLFIDSDGTITHIVEWTIPLSEEHISSGGPVQAVLELNAGTSARLGIQPGDHIKHSLFEK